MIYTSPPSDFKPKFEIAIGVVEHDGEILFLQRQVGKGQENEWGVPAGKLDAGEDRLTAAQREVQEKTSIEIPLDKITYITTLYDRYPTFDFAAHIFHAVLPARPVVILRPAELQAYRWVTPQKAITMNHMLDIDEGLKTVYKNLQ